MRRAKRYPTFVSLVTLDMSHIDSPGELENFSDLTKFQDALKQLIVDSIRETDLISSFGPGRISILLIETSKEGARAFSRRLKKSIKYFLCNNTRSPLNWRVPAKESFFPDFKNEEESIMAALNDLGNGQ